MAGFRFYHPIEVRYGDLDPQGHVNNASYLTYMEQARIAYIHKLGLWEGESFINLGIILANAHVEFRDSILFGHSVRVGVRISRLGNKSMEMEYIIEDGERGSEVATGSTTLVAYDYRDQRSVPIPMFWRQAISDFEGIT